MIKQQIKIFIEIDIFNHLDGNILEIYNDTNILQNSFFKFKAGKQKSFDLILELSGIIKRGGL